MVPGKMASSRPESLEKQGGKFRTTADVDLQPLHKSFAHTRAESHLGTLWDEWGPGKSGDLQVAPLRGFSDLCELCGPKDTSLGPRGGASEAAGMASSSPGSRQPARLSLRFSRMLAAAHTLTNVPRDLSQRLLFPDGPQPQK